MTSRPTVPDPSSRSATVQQAADALTALVDAESGPAGRRKIRACLRRFLDRYGPRPLSSLTAVDLIAFKADIARDGLRPSFANDLLTYTRRLLTAAYELELVDRPFRLKVLKNVPRGAVTTKAVRPQSLIVLLRAVAGLRPNLARMMLLQFYGAMRPTELPKILYGHGEEQERGVIAIVGKTTRKTGDLRVVLLSEPALELLANTKPQYLHGNGYRHQCWWIGRKLRATRGDGFIRDLIDKDDLSPHFLRHSAATALLQAGVLEQHWRAAMGRSRPRVDRTYALKENWIEARRAMEVLADLVPPTVLDTSRREPTQIDGG